MQERRRGGGGGGESCGHVFLEVHGFADTVCNIVTTALLSLPRALAGLWSVFPRGCSLARLLAILRAVKLEGKLSRVMTFAAHDPFMELRAVDRNQSDSVELDTGDSLHH